MWLRLMGGLLLLGCGRLWVGERERADRRQIARLTDCCDLLTYIAEQIAALGLPLDEIAATLPPTLSAACPISDGDMAGALLSAAGQLRDGEAATVLSRTAARLGRGGREDQVSLCRTAAQTLGECRDRLAKQADRDRRGRATLCLTACLLVIILLW